MLLLWTSIDWHPTSGSRYYPGQGRRNSILEVLWTSIPNKFISMITTSPGDGRATHLTGPNVHSVPDGPWALRVSHVTNVRGHAIDFMLFFGRNAI